MEHVDKLGKQARRLWSAFNAMADWNSEAFVRVRNIIELIAPIDRKSGRRSLRSLDMAGMIHSRTYSRVKRWGLSNEKMTVDKNNV